MKKSYKFILGIFIFTYTVTSAQDTLHVPKLKAYWQASALFTHSAVFNFNYQYTHSAKVVLRVGYRFYRHGNLYLDSYKKENTQKAASSGLLTGIKWIKYIPKLSYPYEIYGYLGVGINADFLNFPTTFYGTGSTQYQYWYEKGQFQSFSLYGIIGADEFTKFAFLGEFLELGVEISTYQVHYDYYNDAPASNIVIDSKHVSKNNITITPKITFGINIGH